METPYFVICEALVERSGAKVSSAKVMEQNFVVLSKVRHRDRKPILNGIDIMVFSYFEVTELRFVMKFHRFDLISYIGLCLALTMNNIS